MRPSLSKELEGAFMKKQLVGMIIVVSFIASFTVAPKAQTGKIYDIDVPFDFIIKNQILPAGRYSIGRLHEQNPDLLLFRSTVGKARTVTLTQRMSGEAPKVGSMLSFNCYGDRCFLKSVWVAHESYASKIVSGSLERKVKMLAEAKVVSLFETGQR